MRDGRRECGGAGVRGCGGAVAVALALAAALGRPASVDAQQNQAGPQPPIVQQVGRPGAPIDYTGTWVSVVTEDWQWRFVTPIVGDYTGVPMNSVADKLARAWSPEADAKAGEQCKGFGAAAINRLPTRMQIAWVNDSTMKLDWDLGTQSRLVHFDRSTPAGARSLQGHAIGEWIDVPAPGGRGGGGGAAAAAAGRAGGAPAAGRGAAPAARPGGLKITTTNLTPQYLRQNGIPVSDKAVITEYLDIVPGPDGNQWLVVKTSVDDPTYLNGWYIVSSQFKKEANASKWNPTPCQLLPRLRNTATQVPRGPGE